MHVVACTHKACWCHSQPDTSQSAHSSTVSRLLQLLLLVLLLSPAAAADDVAAAAVLLLLLLLLQFKAMTNPDNLFAKYTVTS